MNSSVVRTVLLFEKLFSVVYIFIMYEEKKSVSSRLFFFVRLLYYYDETFDEP